MISRFPRFLALALAALLSLTAASARPKVGTFTWTGGGGNPFWSTAANWQGGVAPTGANDDLVFQGGVQLTNINDLGGTFNSIIFNTPGFTLLGNPVLLVGIITDSTGGNTIGLPINLPPGPHPILVNVGILTFGGSIVGPGGLDKNGLGTLKLTANNGYGGATNVNAGLLIAAIDGALGAPIGGTTVASGATLGLQGGMVYTNLEDLVIDGPGFDGNGALQNLGGITLYPGAVTVAGPGTIVGGGSVPGSTLVLSGPFDNGGNDVEFTSGHFFAHLHLTGVVSGAGGIVKTGQASLTLTPPSPNLYTGFTSVNAGTLAVNVDGALGTTGLGAGTAVAAGATLAVQSAVLYDTAEPVSIQGTGFGGAGAIQSNGGDNRFAGLITLVGDATISDVSGQTLTLSGTITPGAFALTFGGTGTIFLDGTVAGPMEVGTGLTLSGNGTLGDVTVSGGNISPGHSPGCLNTGSITFDSFSTLTVEMDGVTPCSEYDQLLVTGAVDLGDATLAASLTFNPASGTEFIIIDNDLADPVTGNFAGLFEGDFLTVGTKRFIVSYAGGDGNDVTLTAAPFTWSGASGVDDFWSTGANWVGGTAPVGDGTEDLVFTGAVQTTNTNDIVGSWNSITFNAGGFTLQGLQAIDALVIASVTGSNAINCDVFLGFGQRTIGVTGGAGDTLTINGLVGGPGGIDKTGPATLRLTNSGNGYGGLTNINAGSLAISADGTLGGSLNGSVVAAGAVLRFENPFGQTYSAPEVVTINGNGTGPGSGAIVAAAGSMSVFAGSVVLGSPSTIFAPAGSDLRFDGAVDLNGSQLTLDTQGGFLFFESTISGAGGIVKNGFTEVYLHATNTYGGVTAINDGGVNLWANGALGAVGAGNGTTVANGAKLLVVGGVNYSDPEPVSVVGNGSFLGAIGSRNLSGPFNATFAGPITLTGAAEIRVNGSAPLTLNGSIDNGGFNLSTAGNGTLTMNGPISGGGGLIVGMIFFATHSLGATNSYGGATQVLTGTLEARADGALGAIGAPTFVNPGSSLAFGNGVNYTMAEPVVIAGLGVSNAGALQGIGAGNAFNGPVTLVQPSWVGTAAGSSLTLTNSVDTGAGNELQFRGAGDIAVSGVIGGSGPVTDNNTGIVTLLATNTFNGQVDIAPGATLVVAANGALGPGSVTTVEDGGTLAYQAPAVYGTGEVVTINGIGVGGAGALTTRGTGFVLLVDAITLGSDARISHQAGPNSLTLQVTASINTNSFVVEFAVPNGITCNAPISGTGGLVKSGAGPLHLGATNTYLGTTDIQAGQLFANVNDALGSAAGGTTVQNGAALRLNGAGLNYSTPEPLGLNGLGGGVGALNAALGTSTWTGPITIGATGTIIACTAGAGTLVLAPTATIDSGNFQTRFFGSGNIIANGVISGPGGSVLNSMSAPSGTLTLAAANTYGSTTVCDSGTLNLTGSVFNNVGLNATAPGSATLAGTGTVGGNISDFGTGTQFIAPAGSGVGTLTCTNLLLDSTTTIVADLNGAAAYDKLIVNGGLGLNGCTLSATIGGGWIPSGGDVVEILNKTSGGPVTGTFAGLPEGAYTTISGRVFRVSYVGGTGNDVTLTVFNGSVWSGASILSSNWSDDDNWVGNVAPVPGVGTNLLFTGTQRQNNTNDFGVDADLGTITIDGNGFVLDGAEVRLNLGIENRTGNNTISFPILLAADAVLDVTGTRLDLNGAIIGGFGLTKVGPAILGLNATNGYVGDTIINNGTIQVTQDSALGDQLGATFVNTPGALMFGADYPAAESVTIDGGGIGIPSITNSGPHAFAGPITLASPSVIGTVSGTLTLGGPIDLGAFDLTITGPALIIDVRFDGTVGGAGGLVMAGLGSLWINTANSYDGLTTVQSGMVFSASNDGLGTLAAGTVVASGGCLGIAGDYTTAEPVLINGTGTVTEGAFRSISLAPTSFAGPITLASASSISSYYGPFTMTGGINTGGFPLTIDVVPLGTLAMNCAITGAGGVTKIGSGTLTFSAPSTYSGPTQVSNGRLIISSNNALGTAASGTDVTPGAILEIIGPLAYGMAEDLAISGAGALVVSGSGLVSWAGQVSLGGNASTSASVGTTLQLDGAVHLGSSSLSIDGNGNTMVNGIIDGVFPGGVTKNGAGSATLTAANTYMGSTNVNAGTFAVDGSTLNSQTIVNGGTLGGSGSLSTTTVFPGGTISPGFGAPAILNTGSFSTEAGVNVNVNINGATPGVGGYDQFNVTGNVSYFTGPTLNLTVGGGFVPNGESFVIVNNDGGDPKSGFFAGLFEGDYVVANGYLFQITYAGNTGNDTVLTHIPAFIWNGAGADDNWTTAQNWVGGVAPIITPGTSLVFQGAARTTNVNDFPAGSTFASITFNTPNFSVTGNGLTLNGSIIDNSGGPTSFAADVTMASTATFTIGAGVFSMSGAISGAAGLTKAGAGELVLATANSYTGTTQVNAGVLTVLANNALGTVGSGTTVALNATLAFSGTLTYATAEPVQIDGNGVGANGAILGVAGTNSFAGPISMISDSRLGAAGGADLTLSGGISGGFGVTKVGAGTITLAAAGTYAGDTNILQGTLAVSANNALGATGQGTFVSNGASLAFTGNFTYGSAEPVTINGPGATAGAIFLASGTSTFAGPITLGSDATIASGTGINSLTLGGNINNAGFLLTAGRGILIVNGQISGGGGLSTFSSSSLRLNASNSYAGPTTIITGTSVTVASNNALGTNAAGTAVASGASLEFTGNIAYTTTEAVSIAGNGGAGAGAIRNFTGSNSFDGPITLTGAAMIGSSAGGATLTLNGTVNNAGFLLTCDGFGNTNATGAISGGGGLTKQGTGRLTLTGNNGYAGATSVAAGVLRIGSANALGTAAAGTTVTAGAALEVGFNITYVPLEAITLNGSGIAGAGVLSLVNGSGDFHFPGPITLGSAAEIETPSNNLYLDGSINTAGFALTIDGASTTKLNGALSGSGTLTKNGAGALEFFVANPAYTGAILLNAPATGIVYANNALGSIGSGTTVASGATLALAVALNYSSVEPLSIAGSGVSGNGALEGAGSTFAGVVTLTSGATIASTSGTLSLSNGIVNGGFDVTIVGSGNTAVSGVISGTGGLVKNGSGGLNLFGACTMSGPTSVNGGALLVFGGSLTSSTTTVATGGALGGTGTMGPVITSGTGTVSPGSLAAGTATLNTGSVTLVAGSFYSVQILGPAAGQFDRLNVTGTVDLGGATLTRSLTDPLPGQYTIISNDSNDAVVGTFAGLAEGATFLLGGVTFSITYQGGDGNDVVLTHLPTVQWSAAAQNSAGVESGAMTVTAQLSEASGVSVTIPFALGGTATGADYSLSAASPITILAGATTGSVDINITTDILDEADETVILTMGTATNATASGTVTHTATINDDDATPTVSWSAATQSNLESVTTVTVTATLSAVSGRDVTVPFTVGGTATDPADYGISATPITITAGNPNGSATITVVNDPTNEPNETVILTMGVPNNATATPPAGLHTATIVDNDPATVTNVSSVTADGFYGIGQIIDITVSFSENVIVTGTPQLTLETGTSDAVVNYFSGSGSTTLTFRYTVVPGQLSPDLDYVATTSLALNSGTIVDADGIVAALTLPAPGGTSSLSNNKDIVVVDSNPPDVAMLFQRRADGTTDIPVGGATNESIITFVGVGFDMDGDMVTLQLEVLPAGQPFTGAPAIDLPYVAAGVEQSFQAFGAPAGDYHWQARFMDYQGVCGPWVAFGGNADPNGVDFTILPPPAGNQSPLAPAGLGQFHSGGVYPVAVGATVTERVVAFKATVTDPEGQPCKLLVEVRPNVGAFFGFPTAESPFVPSGSEAVVLEVDLMDGAYHWQAWVEDANGGGSPIVAFGGSPDFIISGAGNAPPASPQSLSQHDHSAGAVQPAGFVDDDTLLVFKGLVTDTDTTDSLRLQVEIRTAGTPFLDSPSGESAWVPSGSVAEVALPFVDTGNYHWQARTQDSSGLTSAWVSFGGNAETSTDVGVDFSTNAMPAISNLDQRQGDGTTSIAIGGVISDTQVIFTAVGTDAEGQAWKLGVEVQPTGTPFTGFPTSIGALVPSGSPASVTIAGLLPGSYHWEARGIDDGALFGASSSFGANPEANADFTINPGANNSPSVSALDQRRADGTTSIAQAGSTNEDLVTFRGTVNSGDAGQLVRMVVEIKPVGTPFANAATATSAWVTSGSSISVQVPGYSNGVGYHWQAVAEDSAGDFSVPLSYGTNLDPGDPDFSKSANTAPTVPTGVGQYRINQSTVVPIAVGGTIPETGLSLIGSLGDPDAGDSLRLEIELQPIGAAFADAPTAVSAAVAVGQNGGVDILGLADLVGYHWQFRSRDSSGAVSAWTVFGGNSDPGDADFRVDKSFLAPSLGFDEPNSGYCNPFSAGAAAPWAAIFMIPALVLAGRRRTQR